MFQNNLYVLKQFYELENMFKISCLHIFIMKRLNEAVQVILYF